MQDFTEKRKYPRVPFTGSVEIEKDGNKFFGILKNISLGGIAVELPELLDNEESYTFVFSIPTASKIKARGAVRWMIPKNGVKLYGIEFHRIGLFSRLKLASFIKILLGNDIEKVARLSR